MGSKVHFASPKESGETNMISSRRRPLHTCAVSFLTIAHKTAVKAGDLNGPVGTMVKRSAKFAALAYPIFSMAQYLFLATLSFADDCILACEDNLGSLYPSSNRVFDKIDELVLVAETLPDEFDSFSAKSSPSVTPQTPFLEWVTVHVIALFKFIISSLKSCWGWGSREEKDVLMDENYGKQKEDLAVIDPFQPKTRLNKEAVAKELDKADDNTVQLEGSGEKEVTVKEGNDAQNGENGAAYSGSNVKSDSAEVKEGNDAQNDENGAANSRSNVKSDSAEVKEGNDAQNGENDAANSGSSVKSDSEASEKGTGWVMNPKRAPKRKQKGKKKRGNIPRSESYT